jgi:hypothetical protein
MKLKRKLALSDSGFVFDPTTGDSYSLNPVGQELLGLIKEGKELEEIKHFITSKYDVEAGVLERYYQDFVSLLKQFQLIEEDGEN